MAEVGRGGRRPHAAQMPKDPPHGLLRQGNDFASLSQSTIQTILGSEANRKEKSRSYARILKSSDATARSCDDLSKKQVVDKLTSCAETWWEAYDDAQNVEAPSLAERRVRPEETAAAAAAEYGEKKVTLDMLRELCSARYEAPEEAVASLYGFFGDKGLSTVAEVREYHAVLYEQVKDSMDDHVMAFKKLCQVLGCKRHLAQYVACMHRDHILEEIPGASLQELYACTGLRPVLDMCTTVSEQYEKDMELRISSKYKLALDKVETEGKTSKADLSRLKVRREVYADTGACDTCPPLDNLNVTELGRAFDPKTDLLEGAQNYSIEGFDFQLAAKPGSESRSALSKIANAAGVLCLILLMPWLCYCWASIAQIENFHVACCVMLVFGSYTMLPMATGTVGAVYALIAFGMKRVSMNGEAFEKFKVDIKSTGGRVIEVNKISFSSPGQKLTFERLDLEDDKGKKVVLVKRCEPLSPTVVNYQDSEAPLGGKKLLRPGEEVTFVRLETLGKEHPFVEYVIKYCSTKLAALVALGAFLVICVDCGLNKVGNSMHYLPLPECPALLAALKAIIPDPHEAFLAVMGRGIIIYDPPTKEQHSSTLKLIDTHETNGTTAFVHHQRDENAKTNSLTAAFSRQAEMTDEKAVLFTKDVLKGTLKDEYGVCQNGVTVEGKGAALTSLTPMQKMKAMLLSDPENKEAIAYLKPRVGAVHVEKLQACGRALKENENEILALAPAASASKKRRV